MKKKAGVIRYFLLRAGDGIRVLPLFGGVGEFDNGHFFRKLAVPGPSRLGFALFFFFFATWPPRPKYYAIVDAQQK